jgi:hypothetical protein
MIPTSKPSRTRRDFISLNVFVISRVSCRAMIVTPLTVTLPYHDPTHPSILATLTYLDTDEAGDSIGREPGTDMLV